MRDWKSLSGKDRRKPLALARHGKPHPDPKVATVGARWADAILRSATPQSERWLGRAVTILLSFVAPAAIGGGSYADNPGGRWTARKILDANKPPS
jgi:hypothetical protein